MKTEELIYKLRDVIKITPGNVESGTVCLKCHDVQRFKAYI